MFKSVEPKVDFPKLEEETLKYWKKNRIFEKSVETRPENKTWTFLDGPPFITGLPHYGSLLSSLPKDVFPRFWTMKGYRVRRVWGWDCHGLPAENKVETKLGLKSKREIEEKIGVKKFIDECKLYVSEVSSEWEWYIDHIGRWVDFKNAYKTMDTSYMESVMWVFKKIYNKGLIYKGLRVSLYCPHCATPISNFEVAMDADNHKEILDAATTYKYELRDEKNTFVLAWSTTPWNKIVTPALAVNSKLTYVKVKQGNEFYILAKSTIGTLKKEPKYEIIEEFKGTKLVGKKFVPHYDYYPLSPGEKSFEIISGDFVTAVEGTGVVTIAAYGEEDLKAMEENNIHIEMHLDDEGMIKKDVPKFGGMYYLKANKAVNVDLASRGLIYKDEESPHSVPLCWRCHTRLYYAPQNAWYVNVENLKKEMEKTNEYVNWFPKHFKHGRFLKSLQNAPDWNISRSRYWGSPVPVWECECGERFVPGSIKELEIASGQKITDLHKPGIDAVAVVCSKCGGKAHRTPEVLDSWIEAGSASFGERHYPFDQTALGKEPLKKFYPPDFIGEYTGQIRAWFYVLHVIANALALLDEKNNVLSRNVLVEGVILGTDGRKMSKNYGNYPDPKELLEKYGGDALRLYLLGSPVMHGEDIIISEENYRNQVRGMMLILWNVYNFFVTYANIDQFQNDKAAKLQSKNVLDKWILSLLNRLVQDVTKSLESFDTVLAVEMLKKFVDDLSTWYIRRSRDRSTTAENETDKQAFFETTYKVLTMLCKITAPIVPFLSEEIYRNLTGEKSVHLSQWPMADSALIDKELEKKMQLARLVVELGHSARKSAGIKLKQPLQAAAIYFRGNANTMLDDQLNKLVENELNVKQLLVDEAALNMFRNHKVEESDEKENVKVTIMLDLNNQLIAEGEARDIVRKIQEERKKLGTSFTEKVHVSLESWPEGFTDEIKRKALVDKLTKGEMFKVQKTS